MERSHAPATAKTPNGEGLGDQIFHELLPGIQDDVTLDVIAPKLSWGDLNVLYLVSRNWRQAIQGRLVYDARVRLHSTERLLVFVDCLFARDYNEDDVHSLGLYSERDNVTRELPYIQGVSTGIPYGCHFVSLDGKIYVLGGAKTRDRDSPGISEVHVFDAAGNRQWQKLTPMHEPRHGFGIGVLHGKIYVFGGMSNGRPVSGSEVYDPKVDAWSPIACMPSLRFRHLVITCRGQFYMRGGASFDQADVDRAEAEQGEESRKWFWGQIKEARTNDIHVYDPDRDMWRLPRYEAIARKRKIQALFMGEDLPCLLNENGLRIYHEVAKKCFLKKKSFSGLGSLVGSTESAQIMFLAAELVDGELFALVRWHNTDSDLQGMALIRSEWENIEWRILQSCSWSGISKSDGCYPSGGLPFLCIKL